MGCRAPFPHFHPSTPRAMRTLLWWSRRKPPLFPARSPPLPMAAAPTGQ